MQRYDFLHFLLLLSCNSHGMFSIPFLLSALLPRANRI